MSWAWPPSWALPASNEARVRVLEKKNSIARTRSRRSGWAIPSARSRLSWAATSRTVSMSSRVHSSRLMRSRPRSPVCIPGRLFRRAEHEAQQGHPEGDAVERLDPVALVAGLVDILGQLVHPRQRVQDDRAPPGLRPQELGRDAVGLGCPADLAAALHARLGLVGLDDLLHVDDVGLADDVGHGPGLAVGDAHRVELGLERRQAD